MSTKKIHVGSCVIDAAASPLHTHAVVSHDGMVIGRLLGPAEAYSSLGEGKVYPHLKDGCLTLKIVNAGRVTDLLCKEAGNPAYTYQRLMQS